jgi:formylglycine-generating enzyme required for sulfatase activity
VIPLHSVARAVVTLNAPFHGSGSDAGASKQILVRRMELRERYANVTYNPEQVTPGVAAAGERVMPAPADRQLVPARPTDVGERGSAPLKFDLGDGIAMELAPIPAGSFSMGSNCETPVEQPVMRVRIAKPFHMGATEVTLEQYRQFDPECLNGVYDMHYKDQIHRGYYMHGNAAEWTRSAYQPYPYHDSDGRNSGGEGTKTVRGGSWHDRPFRSTSSYRLGFPAWQRVYHTGFRIIVED